MKNFLLAVGILAGTIIGAGVFSLPYVFTKLGILTGVLYLIAFGLIYYIIHRRYMDILQSEDLEEHHFSYFAKKYLSKFWGKMSSGLVILELVFALTIYLILSKSFAGLIFGEAGIWAVLVFWALGSVLIFGRGSLTGWSELIGGLGIILITFLILLAGGQEGTLNVPATQSFDLFYFLLPFGPLLFSFSGRAAVSKVVMFHRELPERKRFPLKKVILWGTIIPAFVYFVFVLGVLRIAPDVSPDTVGGLAGLPYKFLMMIGITGLLSLWTSYFVLGDNVYDILRFDILKKNAPAAVIVLLTPLLLYFLGFQNFITTVSIAGGFFLAFEAIFINTMWVRMRKMKGLFWTIPLYAVFIVSILYQILKVSGIWGS